MNKIMLTTDDHFTSSNFDKVFEIYRDLVIPTCLEHDIDTIINLGDFTDKRIGLDAELTYRLLNEFVPLIENNNLTMYMILGNHQMYHKDSRTINTLEIFKRLDNFIIIDEEPKIIFLTNETEDKKLLLYPWLLKEEKPDIPNDIDVVLGHFEVVGGYMSKSYQITTGLDPKALPSDRMVISGHYHIKQSIKNIHYLGTAWQKNRNDFSEEKGIHILHLQDKPNIEFIPNRISPIFYEMVIRKDPFNNDSNVQVIIASGIEGDEDMIYDDLYKNKQDILHMLNTHNVKIFIDRDIRMIAKLKSFLIELSKVSKIDIERSDNQDSELNVDEDRSQERVDKDIETILREVIKPDAQSVLDEIIEEVNSE